MNRLTTLLVIFCIPVFSGCYIQRYNDLKAEYENFRKDMSKVRSKNSTLKTQKQSKLDSIQQLNHAIANNKKELTRSDSMVEAYTLQIREKLGQDPWGDSVKKAAASASSTKYNSDEEKNVIYWLNLARMQPDLFVELYLDPWMQLYSSSDWPVDVLTNYYMEQRAIYLNTAYLEMAKMKSLNTLKPDEKLFQSAECHAKESGKTGYVGHDRTNCKEYFSGECCDYGVEDGKSILLDLLVDEGVPSLGHRHICLGGYRYIGVSQQPHITYCVNTVLDFD
jgi:hypothetical protein